MLHLHWPTLRTYWFGFGALALLTLLLPRLTPLPLPLPVLLMAVAAGAALAWERRVYLPLLLAGLLVGALTHWLLGVSLIDNLAFNLGMLGIALGFAEVAASLRRSREDLLTRLTAAETLLQAGLDALPDALALLDAQGVLRFSNQPWQALAASLGERPLQTWLTQPATRAAAQTFLARLDEPASAALTTVEVNLPEGTIIEMSGRSFDLQGRPHLLLTLSDRTLQRRAEAEARRSHRLLESTFQSLSDAVLLLAPGTHQIVDCNLAAEQLFGYPRAELVGETIARLHVDGRAYQVVNQRVKAALTSEGVFRGMEYLRRRDGRMLPLEITVRSADGSELYLAVFHDLSESYLAEQNLRASEIKFRAFVENQSDGVLLVDASGEVIEWNRASEQILGIRRDEIIGRKVWEALGDLGGSQLGGEAGAERLRLLTLHALAEGDDPFLNHPLEIPLGDGRVIQQTLFVIETEVGRMLAGSFRDVTEANRLLAELRRQSLVFEHLHGAIVMVAARDFTIVDWNAAAARLFGYPRSAILGQAIVRLHPADSVPQRGEILQALIQNDRWQGTIPFVRQDGSSGLAELVLVPTRDSSGQLSLIAAIYHDVTERQQREDLILQQRDFLTAVIEASSEGITVSDEHLRFTFYNSHMHKITGYAWDEAQQPDFLQRLMPEAGAAARDALVAAAAGAVFENREWLITRRDGAQRTLLVSTRLLDQYHPRQLLTTMRDITDRKRLEQVLQENERKLRLFIENFQGIAYQARQDTSLILFSGRVREITGYSAEDFLSGRIHWSAIIHPDDLSGYRQDRANLLQAQGHSYSAEYRILQRDGRVVWVQDLGQSLIAPTSEVVVQGVVYDVTDRHKMEAELRFLSTHDALTGLYNRAFFEAEVTRRQGGRRFPISFVIADLNNLKTTNDSQGHAAGDVLIAQVSELLRACFRHEDLIARIGGDEFGVILPGADEGMVAGILERVAAQMRPPLSLALGAATAYAGDDLHAMIRLADDRMYIEKRSFKSAAEG